MLSVLLPYDPDCEIDEYGYPMPNPKPLSGPEPRYREGDIVWYGKDGTVRQVHILQFRHTIVNMDEDKILGYSYLVDVPCSGMEMDCSGTHWRSDPDCFIDGKYLFGTEQECLDSRKGIDNG